MRCDRSHEELAAYAAADLEPEPARALKAHLADCPDCRRRLAALKSVDVALRMLTEKEVPPGAVLAARRALKAELPAPVASPVMTLEEVAAYLRLDLVDLEALSVDLPAFEIAGKIRVRRDKLEAWLAEREREYARRNLTSTVALRGVFAKEDEQWLRQ